MDLGVEEIGLIFYGKHPLLMTKIQVSDPSCLKSILVRSKGNKLSSYSYFKRRELYFLFNKIGENRV